jgi:hypothetical protein
LGLFDQLFKSDPTSDWPAPSGKVPAIDLESARVGPLRLGAAFGEARAYGRPARFAQRALGAGQQLLEYGGYEIAFEGGTLACFRADLYDGGEVSVAGLTLRSETTVADVRAWLGEPTTQSAKDDLVWLSYVRGPGTLDLEFDDEGLACVQFYREGWA